MRGLQRWWPWAGVLYVALFVVAFVLVGDTGESAEDTADVLTDSADRFFGAYLVGLLSMLPLLAFFAGLRDLVRDAAPGSRALATLTAVPEIVRQVDLDARRVVIRPPEGLLEL